MLSQHLLHERCLCLDKLRCGLVFKAILVMVALAGLLLLPPYYSGNFERALFPNVKTSLGPSTAAALAQSLVEKVLTTPAGPDDFPAVGDAVHAINTLFELHDSFRNGLSSPASTVLPEQQLSLTLQHLFPFLPPQQQQHVINRRDHHRGQGLVIPCGNSGFQVAVQLVAAGIAHLLFLWLLLLHCSLHSLACSCQPVVACSQKCFQLFYPYRGHVCW